TLTYLSVVQSALRHAVASSIDGAQVGFDPTVIATSVRPVISDFKGGGLRPRPGESILVELRGDEGAVLEIISRGAHDLAVADNLAALAGEYWWQDQHDLNRNMRLDHVFRPQQHARPTHVLGQALLPSAVFGAV